ncbi:siderophore ABC transporter substrate-binding protein [Paracoccus benzoatiresistens]|uniref:Siderophore ABC transporter substrate-binding protein n=1 Tax=Paracoccus benzoatiresistens TaxID=2997341 RepID=A0ABT4J8A9_9RHOB|nr:siderophore ABC transporter substrate-binding protein [Paracoccus sp. EF6]MCZ0963364.1 siderophore ABC transporter substrate-binding protein [Paracoccus sp. EF6]
MRTILLAGLSMMLAQPALSQVTIETAQGPRTIAETPSAIAALDLGIVDTMMALGVTPAAVPEKLFLDYLQPLAGVSAPAGSLQEPDLEKLAEVGPDLIIVANRTSVKRDAVAQVAPAIDMTVDGATLVDDAKARISGLATLLGKKAEGEALTAALDAKLAALSDAGRDKGSALVLLTNGPKMSAYGAGSRFGWLYEATGMARAGRPLDEKANHGDAVSHEFIAQTDPDWLFVLDRGAAIGAEGQSAEATLDNELVRQTKAWKNGHVVYLPAGNVYLAPSGYTALTETLEVLTDALSG